MRSKNFLIPEESCIVRNNTTAFSLFLLGTLHGLWNLSSPTRGWTCVLGSESRVLTIRPSGNSSHSCFVPCKLQPQGDTQLQNDIINGQQWFMVIRKCTITLLHCFSLYWICYNTTSVVSIFCSFFRLLAINHGPLTRDQTHKPCIGRQSLNHCGTREAPSSLISEW